MNRLTVKYRYDPENPKAKNRVTYFLNGEPIVTLGLGRRYATNVRLAHNKLCMNLVYCYNYNYNRSVTYPVKQSVLALYGITSDDVVYLSKSCGGFY